MADRYDLAILGSGFGGSLVAMVARRLGLSVLLLERGTHPRFAIGESTSPLANLLLEELAAEYDLPRLAPFTTYGTWKRAYPEVTVGLKRGFTFYRHRPGEPFAPDPERRRQLLVAASPADEVADTHWFRAEFDYFLVREAQSLGAEYLDRVEIGRIERAGAVTQLWGERAAHPVSFRARFVVDATGPRGALSRLLGLPEAPWETLPRTQALFSHFEGVAHFADLAGTGSAMPPYPPDDAALHHLFPGGWMWVLRFENGITSAGFAVEPWLAEELRLSEGEPAWRRFLARFPSIGEQFAGARPVLPFIHAPALPYRCAAVTGPGWALLPSAAAFIDPLFSTGFPLTLLGIHRLGRTLRGAWDTRGFDGRLQEYAAVTQREAATAADLVGGCYAAFADFPGLAALSMLYFVAASYSEMARRLDRRDRASEFLLQNQPAFRAIFRRWTADARRGAPPTLPDAREALEPFNIAGLCDPAKRNWYGVDLTDVVRGAAKLACTPQEVSEFFARMGW
jgi:tetracycline 7-halogenase / FADH2 O2-dependent halogenase